MSQYQLVVFDWDGTLMDSTADITRAIQAASADLGLPVPSDEQASWVIGLSLKQALKHAVPDLRESDVKKFIERYQHHFFRKDPEMTLFDGVIPMLEALANQNVLLAVATGKSRRGLDRALARGDLGHWFAATRCADETAGKPHPAMLFEILNELGLKAESAVMVGDTSHDLTMAANASMAGLGVTYGAHPESELNQISNVGLVTSLPELQTWLLERSGS